MTEEIISKMTEVVSNLQNNPQAPANDNLCNQSWYNLSNPYMYDHEIEILFDSMLNASQSLKDIRDRAIERYIDEHFDQICEQVYDLAETAVTTTITQIFKARHNLK